MNNNLRITVVNERLFRVEYSETGRFLDRPSFAFIARKAQREPVICSIGRTPVASLPEDDQDPQQVPESMPAPSDQVWAESNYLRVCLEQATGTVIVCTPRCRKSVLERTVSEKTTLSAGNLKQGPSTRYRVVQDKHNRGGTLQTLDECDGWYHMGKQCDIRERDIGNGFFSTDGLAIINDSDSPVFIGSNWEDPFEEHVLVPRETVLGHVSHIDLYLFEHSPDHYEQSFPELMRDYVFPYIGAPKKPPRTVFGAWFSRYWAYAQQDIVELIRRFENNDPSDEHDSVHRCPLRPPVHVSVLVIDMDWHQPNQWTGFSWNRELFPDPEALLAWLHERSHPVHVVLNLHPADGIAASEDVFAQARSLVAPGFPSNDTIPFHISDGGFRRAYFGAVLRALENDPPLANQTRKHGVDFWWIDWQQGVSEKDGFNPMPLLNHFHYHWAESGAREGRLLPVILSRWPGVGGHRYPVGFSGDTVASWSSLAMQPEFTTMAANVGYYYWSHDIGGHYGGDEDPERYVRWVQWGCFSPILRLHCSKNDFMSRTPWAFHSLEVESVVRHVLRLRSSLEFLLESVPAHVPVCAPMYHYAWREASSIADYLPPVVFEWNRQYYFGGPTMIVAPFVGPREESTQLSSITICLPAHRRWIVWDDGIAAFHPCMDLKIPSLSDRTVWNQEIPSGVPLHRFGELRSLNVFLGEGAIVPRCVSTKDGVLLRITLVAGRKNLLEIPSLSLRITLCGANDQRVLLERRTNERPREWYHPNKITHLEVVMRKPDHGTVIRMVPADTIWQQPDPIFQIVFTAPDKKSFSANESACACVKLFLHHFRLRSDIKEHLYNRYQEVVFDARASADIERFLKETATELTQAQVRALQEAHLYGMAAFAAPFVGDQF
ncbi:hypothetical protein CCYA_CCYA09G2654 [Cyanidiococcus yangmingshanensis]|nr:hypothetical protein CCYA_CCYA09G2654 [Cyanidiococcus yangmingshanensis]